MRSLLLLLSAMVVGWGLEIGVSIPPQKYIIEAIGGNRVSVEVVLPKGATPVTYNPTMEEVAKLRKLPLFFSIGVPFESKFLPKLREWGVPVVDMGKWIKRRKSNGVIDPHIWLSPPLLMVEGEMVLQKLIELDPSSKTYYLNNYNRFVRKLLQLNRLGFKVAGRSFITFHPAYSYLAATYNLHQLAIEESEGASSISTILKLVEKGRREGVKVVFIAPEYPKRVAEMVARQLGAKVVVVSPLDNPLTTIKKVLEGLE